MLNIILGQGLSSRLKDRIRNDLHLAYSIGSRASSASDCGSLSINAATDELDVQKALDEIFKTISELLEVGISDKELVKAKNKLLSAILFNLENTQYYAEYCTSQLLLKGAITSLNERFDKIQSASKKDLMRVANHIFSDSPKIVLLTKSLKKIDLNYKI